MNKSSFSRVWRYRCATRSTARERRAIKRQAARSERRAGRAEERGQEAQAERFRSSRPSSWDVV